MSLQQTACADRIHISFFGMRNAGKSSLLNAVTGQSLSVVSDVRGTTTDPVKKAMELLPIGPVVIIDTPGFDDEGKLGELRVQKTREVLGKTDIAIVVTDSTQESCTAEKEFIDLIHRKNLPYIIVHNKADLLSDIPTATDREIWVSAANNININQLKEKIGQLSKPNGGNRRIVGDLLSKNDVVILVTPIDESAPKGRLILPQQQTIRDILDAHCTAMVCQDTELAETLAALAKPPKMVITDSQAFGRVSKTVPAEIPLTSFSILFARYKGSLKTMVSGAAMLSKLRKGDKILISEGCTHHRQCGDIGTVKLPAWINNFCGEDISFDFTSGGEFPEDLSQYKLVVHCGGCMLNEAEMKHRISTALQAGVPIVNYGVAIAHMNGILKRSLELFPAVLNLL
ncbi:MAG: [Clostridia bacterium]|nr:[FeFe] hydrogenase H-cluster maturation GTPase HydF [Clostridia bacterium]